MQFRSQIAAMVRALDDEALVELHSLAALGQRHLELAHATSAPAPKPVAAKPSDPPQMTDNEAAIYRAIVSSEDPVSSREIIAAAQLRNSTVYETLRTLIARGIVFRGGNSGSRATRYAVTQEAADAAYQAALGRH